MSARADRAPSPRTRARPPTERQRRVLGVIAGAIARRGYPPTIREIANELGIRSTNGVYDHLVALEARGLIEWDARVSRGIRVLEKGREEMDDATKRSLAIRVKALISNASEGPWTANATPYAQTDAQVRGRAGQMIAVVSNEDDAELIAAAPALLAKVLPLLTDRSVEVDAVIDACAKAVVEAGAAFGRDAHRIADAVRRAGAAAAGRVA